MLANQSYVQRTSGTRNKAVVARRTARRAVASRPKQIELKAPKTGANATGGLPQIALPLPCILSTSKAQSSLKLSIINPARGSTADIRVRVRLCTRTGSRKLRGFRSIDNRLRAQHHGAKQSNSHVHTCEYHRNVAAPS